MMADRTPVLALVIVATVLLAGATVTGNAVLGWASIVVFCASLAAYFRWRALRRRLR
jgi:hypothetical protein